MIQFIVFSLLQWLFLFRISELMIKCVRLREDRKGISRFPPRSVYARACTKSTTHFFLIRTRYWLFYWLYCEFYVFYGFYEYIGLSIYVWHEWLTSSYSRIMVAHSQTHESAKCTDLKNSIGQKSDFAWPSKRIDRETIDLFSQKGP